MSGGRPVRIPTTAPPSCCGRGLMLVFPCRTTPRLQYNATPGVSQSDWQPGDISFSEANLSRRDVHRKWPDGGGALHGAQVRVVSAFRSDTLEPAGPVCDLHRAYPATRPPPILLRRNPQGLRRSLIGLDRIEDSLAVGQMRSITRTSDLSAVGEHGSSSRLVGGPL
jgi:hypothetical protein